MVDSKPIIPISNLTRFDMFGQATSGNKNPRLNWGIRDGNPRITIFTNDDSDPIANKVIIAAMNPLVTDVLLDKIIEIAKSPELDNKIKLDCDTGVYDQQTRKQIDRKLNSSVLVGKDNEGMVWMTLIAESRPKIKFIFKLSPFHRFYEKDGRELTPAEMSVAMAVSTAKQLKEIFNLYIKDDMVAAQDRFAKNKAGTTKSYNAQASVRPTANNNNFEDDLPV